MKHATQVHGVVAPGFEAVRAEFERNFAERGEIGAAVAAYWRGEKVVDLWGGRRTPEGAAPWNEDTMVVVMSTTKGLSAMTLALANARGWLDYDERVSTYWPEFAQQGKERITVRQLLAHQAGLYVLDAPLDRDLISDLDRLAIVLARQAPAWKPGTRQAYHGITLGFYQGELLRRIDPRHRSLGRFFQEEIATPLGLDVYIRLPEDIPDSRLATMSRASFLELLQGFPLRLALDTLNRNSKISKALRGSELAHDEDERFGATRQERARALFVAHLFEADALTDIPVNVVPFTPFSVVHRVRRLRPLLRRQPFEECVRSRLHCGGGALGRDGRSHERSSEQTESDDRATAWHGVHKPFVSAALRVRAAAKRHGTRRLAAGDASSRLLVHDDG